MQLNLKIAILLTSLAISSTASAQEWSGGYAGGQLGYADFDETLNDLGDTFALDSASFGVHLGYRLSMASMVFGAEVDADFINGELDFNGSASGIDFKGVYRLKASVGYDAGVIMPYASLGYAWAETDLRDFDGMVYGIGLAWQSSLKMGISLELLEHDLSTGSGADADLTTATMRASFNF